MNIDTSSVLQVLILSLGIYLVLGFLRTTRGTGIVRGLAVAAVLAAVGLYVLSIYLDLDELDYLFEVSSGYAVVVLAILFQPELRRGIVHLGENPLIGQLLRGRREEVVSEVVQAVSKMAAKRQGALIAVERKSPLEPYMESAVAVDAEVTSFLLDTIFQHGSALHDGAVVIRGDRVAAAGCLFPLAEEGPLINKSTGTRHRAALGLTEESDAVTIAVSEETGGITLCHAGKMEQKLTPSRLEELLREKLGVEEGGARGTEELGAMTRFWMQLRSLFLNDLGRKLGAVALATGLFLIANENVAETTVARLQVVVRQRDVSGPPSSDVLLIVLPSEDYHLNQPADGSTLWVQANGKRAQFEKLGGPLGGILRIDPSTPPGEREFPLDEVRWGPGPVEEGLNVSWKMEAPPKLELERYARARFQLGPEHLVVDDSQASTRYRAMTQQARIRPSSVQIVGPVGRMEELANGRLPLRLAPLRVEEEAGGTWVGQVGLDETLLQRGLAIVDRSTVDVELPIVPAEFELGPIEKEIRLLALTGPPDEVYRWQPLSTKASFTVRISGIVPADLDPTSSAWIEHTQVVTLFVEDHLRVFVDVGEAQEGEDARARVQTHWTADWRNVLPEDMGASDPLASLELVMQSDPWVHLIAR